MAKITARGAKEVARVKSVSKNPSGTSVTKTFVLRSDGKVLMSVRYVPLAGDGAAFSDPFKLVGTVGRDHLNALGLSVWVRRRGYEVA